MSTIPLNILVTPSRDGGNVIVSTFYVLDNGSQISQTLYLRPEDARNLVGMIQHALATTKVGEAA